MSMNVGSATGDNEPMVEMNTTPLIDVMLVLLVMLIITIPIQTHAVKLDMPVGSPPPPPVPPVVVELGVDFDRRANLERQPRSVTYAARPISADRGQHRSAAGSPLAPEPPGQIRRGGSRAGRCPAHQGIKIGFVGQEQYME